MPIMERWMLQGNPKPETLQLMAMVEQISAKHNCPVWVDKDDNLVPMVFMNGRYIKAAYGYMQTRLNTAIQWVHYYEMILANEKPEPERTAPQKIMDYVVHDVFGKPTGQHFTQNGMLADARESLDEWMHEVKCHHRSIDVLIEYAKKKNVDLTGIEGKNVVIPPYQRQPKYTGSGQIKDLLLSNLPVWEVDLFEDEY